MVDRSMECIHVIPVRPLILGAHLTRMYSLVSCIHWFHVFTGLMYSLVFCGIVFSDLEVLVERCPNIVTLDIR